MIEAMGPAAQQRGGTFEARARLFADTVNITSLSSRDLNKLFGALEGLRPNNS